jgi:hypothetical protein
VISTDKTLGAVGTYTGSSLLFFDTVSESLILAVTNTSGTTAPTSGGGIWYDTTNNFVRIYSNGVVNQSSKVSLPIAIATRTNGSWTSIDQVFNGFGYIGSTVFALPNVKGLIPDGRNDDGSLKNIEFTVQDVITETKSNETSTATLQISLDNSIQTPAGDSYREYPTLKSITKYDCDYYVEETNQMYFNQSKNYRFCVGIITRNSGTVTSLTPKLPFHAVDYNDSSWVSAQAMPSGKYIDLTLGASGSSYTAPANGWFYIAKKTAAASQFIEFKNKTKGYGLSQRIPSDIGVWIEFILPVQKGDELGVTYSASGTLGYFRFIYAEGEN